MVSSARNPSTSTTAAIVVNEQDHVVSFHQERRQLHVEQKQIQMEKKQERLRRYINNRIYIVIGLGLASFVFAVLIQPQSAAPFSTIATTSLFNQTTLSAATAVAKSNNTYSIDVGTSNDNSQAAHQNTTLENHITRTTGDNTVVKAAISKPDTSKQTNMPEAQTLSPPQQPQLDFQSTNSTVVAAADAAARPMANNNKPFITTLDQGFYIQTSFDQTYPIDRIVQVVQGGIGQPQRIPTSLPPGTKSVQAVCEFQSHAPHASHFPHTMQQIYACWSWWQHVDRLVVMKSSSGVVGDMTEPVVVEMQPILIFKGHQKTAAPFVPGLLDVLERSINLTIVEDISLLSNSSSSLSTLMLVSRPIGAYKMSSRLDAPTLRKTILSVLAAAEPATTTSAATQVADKGIAMQAKSGLETKSCKSGGFPRILILNRMETRRIINVDTLQSAIVGLLVGEKSNNSTNNNSTTSVVRVEYFEKKSFAEQVSIMANADIIVSPHGAQLASLPFMKSQPCGAVLEIFPMGYWIPHYFGSLAAASGVNQHACIYLGDPANREAEVRIGSATVQARIQTRKRNLEVPLNRTLHVVEQMIQSWRQCCAANVAG